ncbi:MAG: hypothetical protein A2Y93_13240 [Chloroflexi bacterium RBG_13_68_17]|nr:MAG: hypothetical protein A2Y93_13240 [Chloroflexi bacterium RBG_13_68_17]
MTMLSDVEALAGSIGPRGTGSPGEWTAAEYVAGRLTGMHWPVERFTCRAVATQNAFPLSVDALALAAVALYPVGGPAGRWIAAALALAAAPLLLYTIRSSTSPLRGFLPHVDSVSILARQAGERTPRRRVVILAHLDTNRVRLAWQSNMRRALVPLTLLTLGVLAAIGILYLWGALAAGPGWVWPASLLPAAYVLGTVVTLVREERGAYVPGANDNAASVAVALELASRLHAEPLVQTEAWLAFTGAEETDHAGLRSLLRRYGPELRQADFIGLEGLGGGEIVYLARQGLLCHYRPHASLRTLADTVARRHPALGVGPAEMTVTDEVGTLRRAGYRAICIAGRDPSTGTLPHWHRLDDTVDSVEADALQTAADFVWAMLHELDAEAEGSACAPL